MQRPNTAGLFDVREHGAAGDGHTPDTTAIQAAIDACHEAGGGTVLVPPGTWLTGTIYLRSKVNLHLLTGARLLGSPRREDYNPDDVFPENPVFSRETVTGAHLIIAYRADNVSITGDGTIDGNSAAFFERRAPEERANCYRRHPGNFTVRDWRPGQMVFFCRCTDVTVRDVTLANSPYWTLLLLGCTGARIRGLRISNPPETPNGDGIDIDCCHRVTVSDCIITSGDDCITLRGHSDLLGENAQPCTGVTVSNCVLSTPCNAVRVGVGEGEIRDCLLSDLVIRDTRTGLNVVAAYSERSEHGTSIENIQLSNVSMDVIQPLNIILGQHARPPGAVRGITLSHLQIRAEQGAYISGNPGHRIEDVRLHEVRLVLWGDEVDPEFTGRTPRPSGSAGVPAGLFAREVSGLRLSGLQVRWEDAGDRWRHAVEIEDCDRVALTDLDLNPAPAGGEALALESVEDLPKG
jgi:polygalacturonase